MQAGRNVAGLLLLLCAWSVIAAPIIGEDAIELGESGLLENAPQVPVEAAKDALAAKDAPAKDAHAKDAAPAAAAAQELAPPKPGPVDDKYTPPITITGNAAEPPEPSAAKDTPAKDTPAKDAHAKDAAPAPKQDAAVKPEAPKDTPAKDTPAKDAHAKDAAPAPKQDAAAKPEAPKDAQASKDAKDAAPKQDAAAKPEAPQDAQASKDAPAKDAHAKDAAPAPKQDAAVKPEAPKDAQASKDAPAKDAHAKDAAPAPKQDAAAKPEAPKDAQASKDAPAKDAHAAAPAPKQDAAAKPEAPKDVQATKKAVAQVAATAAPKVAATAAPMVAATAAPRAVTVDSELHDTHAALEKDALIAAGVKPAELKETYDDEEEEGKEQPSTTGGTVATNGNVAPLPEDAPMPKMPNQPPFEARTEEPHAGNDPYQQRGTYTPELKAHDAHMKWEDKNPVKEHGRLRPWDDLNDFKKSDQKMETAKKIADDIFSLTERQIAAKTQKTQLKNNLKDIQRKFKKSRKFLKRIYAKSKLSDIRERISDKHFDQRVKKEAKNPKLAKKNRVMDEMKQEDDALIKSLPAVPTPQAINEMESWGQDPQNRTP